MNEGWFKIHRCLFRKAIWLNSTPEQKVILITLLGMANHEGKEWEWKGKQFKAEAGKFVTSANSVMSKSGTGISRQNVRTALTKFKKYDFLTYESTKTGILVNIVNWGAYQGEKTANNQAVNPKATNRQPISNHDLTTNKNDKNVKNDKKKIYISEFTKNELLIETIIDFMKMRAEIKKPMTDRALQLMLIKLNGLSQDEEIQIKILENSIENCWQGIFPLRDSNKETFEVNDRNYGVFPEKEDKHEIFSTRKGNYRAFSAKKDNSEKEDKHGVFSEKEDKHGVFPAKQGRSGAFSVKQDKLRAFPTSEDKQGEFSAKRDKFGVFPTKEDKHRAFPAKEGKDGSFTQNNGAGENKFNIKIPKWEPNESGATAKDEPF